MVRKYWRTRRYIKSLHHLADALLWPLSPMAIKRELTSAAISAKLVGTNKNTGDTTHDKSVKVEEKEFVPESPSDYAAPVTNAKKPKAKRNNYVHAKRQRTTARDETQPACATSAQLPELIDILKEMKEWQAKTWKKLTWMEDMLEDIFED